MGDQPGLFWSKPGAPTRKFGNSLAQADPANGVRSSSISKTIIDPHLTYVGIRMGSMCHEYLPFFKMLR